jgi:hypothetical protein
MPSARHAGEMSRPDFLSVLDLSPNADAAAVRRAYAARLKKIDPALEPAAFGQLREAYEAALAWLAKPEHPDDVPAHASGCAGHINSPETAIPSPDPEDPGIAASDALEVLRQRMLELHEDDVDVAFDLVRDILRSRHVDARAHFELLLVETLRQGRMPKGWAVFHEAVLVFGWRENEQRTALGEAGHWIARAIHQSEAWYRMSRPQRLRWLAVVEEGRAEKASGELPSRIARRWREVARSAAPLPEFTAIMLPPDLAWRWRTQYEAKHARRDRSLARATYVAVAVLFALALLKLPSCAAERRHDSTYDEVYGHHAAQ